MSAQDELPVALERLVALGQSPDVNIRPVLLRVVVDMFTGRDHHAPADLLQFETIVSHLLDDADRDARLIVAEKLSRHPATPKRLLDRLVAEQGHVAGAVYRNADLDQATLAAAATWSDGDVAQAVAARRDLSAAVITALAERPEPEVLRELARNTNAPLARPVFRKLARRARGDAELARLLATRATNPIDLGPLFPLVGPEQRGAIIEAARRSELGKRQWGRIEGATAATLEHMDRLIRSGERDGFDGALCRALGIDGTVLSPLLHDEGGEVLALALAAAGATPAMAARVFILGDPRIGRSIDKVRALAYVVETVSAPAARRLIDAMIGAPLEARRRLTAANPTTAPRRAESLPSAETVPARREVAPFHGQVRRRG